MGTLKYFILVLFIGFLMGMRSHAVIQAEAEPAVIVVDNKPELKASNAVLAFELERLKSETSKLELILEEKNIDINTQSKLIAEREKEIEYKSQAITSLQAAVDLQASSLLALPLFGILMLYPLICSVNRKAIKSDQQIHTGNGRRKPKHRHPDS